MYEQMLANLSTIIHDQYQINPKQATRLVKRYCHQHGIVETNNNDALAFDIVKAYGFAQNEPASNQYQWILQSYQNLRQSYSQALHDIFNRKSNP